MRSLAVMLLGACASAPRPTPMTLAKVVLYQNGIGYFERRGHLADDRLHLAFARGELDDVLKTLTVLDRLGGAVATVDLPTSRASDRTVALDVRLGAGRAHDLQVSYAVPQPTWKAAYRVVLGERGGGLLQAWAMVANATQEDWRGVQLTLATGAPMSFALDLHTPEYVKRPDAGGVLRAPTVLGPIGLDREVVDRDADGVPDEVDREPRRVVTTDTALVVLQPVTFGPGSEVIEADGARVLATVAQVLRENADIELLEIGGHAAEGEAEAWGLSSRRAAAVQAELVRRGVPASRLAIQPYGATAGSARRVDFTILRRASGEPADPRGLRIDVPAAQRSARAATQPAAVAGSVRYVVREPITIARGAAAMVSIVNAPVGAEEVELWRPDANAPGSDAHPFRAVRLTNTSGFTLEPGPVAIFAGGTFVGDTLLTRLEPGETTWIPYALDGATAVRAAVDAGEQPVRIASLAKGVMTVENAGVRVTTYTWAAGLDPAKRLVIRHVRAGGYELDGALPPGSVDRGDGAAMIAVPIAGGKAGKLVVTEREPRRRVLAVVDARADDLAAYVAGSHLPGEVAAKVAAAVAVRREVATQEASIAALRETIADVSARAAELRDSLRTLGGVRGADELRRKLLASLAAASAAADGHARELGAATSALAEARARLAELLRALTW